MALFGLFAKKEQLTWRRLQIPQQIGALKLDVDGSYELGPICCDQSTSFQGTWIGDALIDKPSGGNEILSIRINGGPHLQFKYDGRFWFALA